jgi:hypothetical protein
MHIWVAGSSVGPRMTIYTIGRHFQVALLFLFAAYLCALVVVLFTMPPLFFVALLPQLPLFAVAYATEKFLARYAKSKVSAGTCPSCVGLLEQVNEARWRCVQCGDEWLASGKQASRKRGSNEARRL